MMPQNCTFVGGGGGMEVIFLKPPYVKVGCEISHSKGLCSHIILVNTICIYFHPNDKNTTRCLCIFGHKRELQCRPTHTLQRKIVKSFTWNTRKMHNKKIWCIWTFPPYILLFYWNHNKSPEICLILMCTGTYIFMYS